MERTSPRGELCLNFRSGPRVGWYRLGGRVEAAEPVVAALPTLPVAVASPSDVAATPVAADVVVSALLEAASVGTLAASLAASAASSSSACRPACRPSLTKYFSAQFIEACLITRSASTGTVCPLERLDLL